MTETRSQPPKVYLYLSVRWSYRKYIFRMAAILFLSITNFPEADKVHQLDSSYRHAEVPKTPNTLCLDLNARSKQISQSATGLKLIIQQLPTLSNRGPCLHCLYVFSILEVLLPVVPCAYMCPRCTSWSECTIANHQTTIMGGGRVCYHEIISQHEVDSLCYVSHRKTTHKSMWLHMYICNISSTCIICMSVFWIKLSIYLSSELWTVELLLLK